MARKPVGGKLVAGSVLIKIASLQDAEAFEAYINRYREATSFSGYDMRGAILNIYKYSRVHSKDDRINGKLLNAYVDLELTYLFTMKDSLLAGGAYNRLHDRGKIALGSVLDDFELFSGKLDVLYALSALSFRMRAFWDKYLGVLFLLYENNAQLVLDAGARLARAGARADNRTCVAFNMKDRERPDGNRAPGPGRTGEDRQALKAAREATRRPVSAAQLPVGGERGAQETHCFIVVDCS